VLIVVRHRMPSRKPAATQLGDRPAPPPAGLVANAGCSNAAMTIVRYVYRCKCSPRKKAQPAAIAVPAAVTAKKPKRRYDERPDDENAPREQLERTQAWIEGQGDSDQ
jgi:hypothetical protein